VAGVVVAGREEALAEVRAEVREPVEAKAERVAQAVARPVVAKAVPAEATRAQAEPAVGPRETMAIITATTQ
jgi:hypothetical protein